jgi:TolB-like protein
LAIALYLNPNSGAPAIVRSTEPASATVLSVAPFANVSGNPDQEYLALGISDSILNDLAQHSELSVRQLLESVNPSSPADYVLQGSVARTEGEIRIVARLLSGEDGAILKALQFERPFHDLLSIEDEIRDIVFTEITGSISAAERSREARGFTDNLPAYDLFLRAQSKLLVRTAPTNSEAQQLYQMAIAADKNFARAYGGLALSYAAEYRNGWTSDGVYSLENAMKFAQTAIGISPDLPEQHWIIGYVFAQQKMFGQAETHLRHAIDLAPDFADAYALLGGIQTYRGRPESTIGLLRDAMRLNPNAGYLYFLLLARAYYFMGDFEQARINLSETLTRNPQSVEAHLYLAAVLLRLDRQDEAEWETMEVLGIEPDFDLQTWSETYPMDRGDQLDGLITDLRLAGFS